MPRHYKCISGDSHLDIRPERWTPRVPKRWRDRAPRTVIFANGNEGILVENRPPRSPGATTITGIPYEKHGLQKYWFEGPGTGAPEQRLWEQDQDGVDAEVLYSHGSYAEFWRGISDDDAYKAMIRAYNEWLAEEYCAYNPHRLLGMGVIPDTGVDDAIAEMEYCAKAGLKGINLHRFPNGQGYVKPEDDKFWAAALDLGMCVTSHTNGGTTRLGPSSGGVFQYPKILVKAGGGVRDPVSLLFRFAGEQPIAALQMAMAGVFDRFPRLENLLGREPGRLAALQLRSDRRQSRAQPLLGRARLRFQSAGAKTQRIFERELSVGLHARSLGCQMPQRDRRRYSHLGQRLRPCHRRLAAVAEVLDETFAGVVAMSASKWSATMR